MNLIQITLKPYSQPTLQPPFSVNSPKGDSLEGQPSHPCEQDRLINRKFSRNSGSAL